MLPAGEPVLPFNPKKAVDAREREMRVGGPPHGSVAVRLVPDPAAEARVHADVLELEPEGPAWQRPVVEVATLEELWPQRAAVGGRGRRLRADQQLAPAEVALELGPEPPASRRGSSRGAEQDKGHQDERESHHDTPLLHDLRHRPSRLRSCCRRGADADISARDDISAWSLRRRQPGSVGTAGTGVALGRERCCASPARDAPREPRSRSGDDSPDPGWTCWLGPWKSLTAAQDACSVSVLLDAVTFVDPAGKACSGRCMRRGRRSSPRAA